MHSAQCFEYRFGFNGKEQDNGIKGSGNSYDFGARIYDSRLGRFLSIDPKEATYPWQSPYVFAANNPILLIDENGEGPVDPIKKLTRLSKFASGTLNHAWNESFNWDKTEVHEIGFIIIERKTTVIIMGDKVEKTALYVRNYVESPDAGGVDINIAVKPGEKLMGRAHTHPYSKSEGEYKGVAFSSADISNMRFTSEEGSTSIVEAGTQRFGLVVTNEEQAQKFFKENDGTSIKDAWNKAYSEAKGNYQDKIKEATNKTLGSDSGVEFYQTTDKDTLASESF